MIITNRLGLSEQWVEAVRSRMDRTPLGWLSVTQLINSTRQVWLPKRHYDKVTMDVADCLPMLFGWLFHGVLEKNALSGISEQRLMTKILGKEVSFTPDSLYLTQETLIDFKFTSVFTVMHGGRDEWFKQTNFYAYLLNLVGISIKTIRLEVFSRDWRPGEQRKYFDYPPQMVTVIPVTMHPAKQVQTAIEERVRSFSVTEKVSDEQLPECTDEERWAKPATWAVKKIDKDGSIGKKAMPGGSKFGSEIEAQEFGRSKNCPFKVEFRAGSSRKCDYCNARPFCNQYHDKIRPTLEQEDGSSEE